MAIVGLAGAGKTTLVNLMLRFYELGANVSAGEKQLLTIARRSWPGRRFLIQDEATSSVDTRTEVLVQKAMSALRTDRMSLSSVVRSFDRSVNPPASQTQRRAPIPGT